mgnify:CR=1 FL=1
MVALQGPEAALASVATGKAVTATATAYPGETCQGEVETIDARIDPATRAVTVRAVFPNEDRRLRPGMLMDVRLFRPERQALVIPEIAVVQVGRDSFVYRVDAEGRVAQAPVRAGARHAGQCHTGLGTGLAYKALLDRLNKQPPQALQRVAHYNLQ